VPRKKRDSQKKRRRIEKFRTWQKWIFQLLRLRNLLYLNRTKRNGKKKEVMTKGIDKKSLVTKIGISKRRK